MILNTKRPLLLISAIAWPFALIPRILYGQSFQLQEVVITAQKREESLQDTPISITALDLEALATYGIRNLYDLDGLAPNVSLTPFPNSKSALVAFIRGIGNNDVQTSQDPAVGIYVDGVYMGRSIGLASDVADLERIEILKGPQGTLYGRNTTGGAINLISAKPDGELGYRQTFAVGNLDYRNSLTSISTPEYAGVSAKFSYSTALKDGRVDNEQLGPDFASDHKHAGRAALRWDASGGVLIDYAYDFSRIKGSQNFYQVLRTNDAIFDLQLGELDSASRQFIKDTFANTASLSRQDSGNWPTAYPVTPSITDVSGHTLTASHENSLGIWKSISSYRQVDETIAQDYSGQATIPWFHVTIDIEQDQWSQEFQWIGDTLDNRLQYVTGLYYFMEDGRETEVDFTDPSTITENRTLWVTNTTYAIYGQATYTFPYFQDRIDLTLGARYTYDDREARKRFDLISGSSEPITTLQDEETFNNFNPSITLGLALSESVSSYAKYVTAYKSGGFNVRSTQQGFSPAFNEEEVDTVELGFKSQFLRNRVRLNAAVFQSKFEDMQTQQILDNTQISRTDVVNAGSASIDGLEFDLMALLTEQLLLSVSYGYTNAEIDQYNSFDAVIANALGVPIGADLHELATVTYAPNHSYHISLDYQFKRFSFGQLHANIHYTWTDEQYGTVVNLDKEGFFINDYGLLNTRLSLSDIELKGDSALELSLWGKNILDEEYIEHDLSLGTHQLGTFGEPRTIGLDLTVSY